MTDINDYISGHDPSQKLSRPTTEPEVSTERYWEGRWRTEKAEIERLRAALNDAIDYIDPNTDPWIHVTAAEMVKRLRGHEQTEDK